MVPKIFVLHFMTADTAKAAKSLFMQIDKSVANEVTREPSPRPKSFIEKRWQLVNAVRLIYN